MRLQLALGLLLLAATPASAAAENWQPVPGETDTYYDADFLRVDQQSGLVLVRSAIGRKAGAGYQEWSDKEPITVSALDCKGDTYRDLGLDFEGDAALPDGWRTRRAQSGITFGVGGAGTLACKLRGTLPSVALP